jgi:hypothetical protein
VTRPRTELTAYAAIAAGVIAAALLLAAPWHWLTLAGALVLACVPAGAAIMCWIDSGEHAAQAGLTLVLSLAIVALVSALMIWTTAWHPQALLALAGAGAASGVLRLWWGARR